MTTNMADTETFQITVVGLLSDISFHAAKCCVQDLVTNDPSVFPNPVVNGMLEFEWDLYIDAKKKEIRGEAWVFDSKSIIFINDQLVGGPQDFLDWAKLHHSYEDFRPEALYYTTAEEAYKCHLNSTNRHFVFMDISINDVPAGRLTIELFTDIVPKTCANFKALCTGEKGESAKTEQPLHYKGTALHRIVKNGWVQGGDTWKPCSGDGGESIYGPVFEDENFAVSHDRRGILGMANKGRHTNGSQFYITLQPTAWMDTKYVAFGQLIEGTETLKKIETQGTINDRPLRDIKITDSGVMTFEF